MCEPASIASMAAGAIMSGLSIMANSKGAEEQEGARDRAISLENGRQQHFQDQSSNMFGATLPLASRENMDARGKEAADTRYTRDAGLLDATSAEGAPAGGITTTGEGKSQIARSVSGALARGKQTARARADVGGFGDATSALGIDLSRAGAWQNIFGSNARNSAALLPRELEQANRAGNGWRTAGAVGGAIGQGAMQYGLAGAPGAKGAWSDLFAPAGTPMSGGLQGPTQGGFFTRMFS